VIRYHDLCIRLVSAKDDVTTFLAADAKADPSQRLYTVPPGEIGEFTQTATSNVSNRSSGTGK
jgi:hypothetical protein